MVFTKTQPINSLNMMTNAKKEEIRILAMELYAQRTRLVPPAKSDIPQLVKDCFEEATLFVEEADKLTESPNIDWEKIRASLRNSDKIIAIRDYRAMTGVGLKEAKDIIDVYEANMHSLQENITTLELRERRPILTRRPIPGGTLVAPIDPSMVITSPQNVQFRPPYGTLSPGEVSHVIDRYYQDGTVTPALTSDEDDDDVPF